MRKILFTAVNGMLKPFKGRGLSNTKIGKLVYNRLFIPNKPNHIYVEGFKLYIHEGKDFLSDSLLMSKEYEPIETNIIKHLINKGDTVIDAGANIGYYTILLSKAVGPNGKVYSFEPGKKCFDILKKNVKENGCDNVILINKALSDKEGDIKFYVNKKDKGSSSIIKDTRNNSNNEVKVVVEGTTLDKEITENITFMKMDIEGAELGALIGGSNLLYNCKKMVIEVPEDRGDFSDIKKLLLKNKYKIDRLDEGNILCTKKEALE